MKDRRLDYQKCTRCKRSPKKYRTAPYTETYVYYRNINALLCSDCVLKYNKKSFELRVKYQNLTNKALKIWLKENEKN